MFGFRRDPKKEFWKWLASHRSEIHAEIKGPRAGTRQHWSVDELGRRLLKVDQGLVHEIGMADSTTIELIVSADGIKSVFPAVIELVKSAPTLPGFKITAFRPRCAGDFQLSIAGNKITDDLLTYKIYKNGNFFGIELFIDIELDQREQNMVGFLSLDQHLGEFDVATGFEWIEFITGKPAGAQSITSLSQEFDALRGLVVH